MIQALETVRTWARMIKFSHSLFALPFAFAGATLAAGEVGLEGSRLVWIVLAMIGARNGAMGFNRLVDQAFDARNPRTVGRELPSGRLSRASVWAFTVLLAGMFLVATAQLELLGFGIFGLVITFGYSFTKRFTAGSHLVLGVALALAPLGGWLAIGRSIEPEILWLATAVMMWVAGFDLIYACQDVEFDRRAGLHSIPARLGVRRALLLARALHGGTLVALIAVGSVASLHPVYWVGMATIGLVLAREHRLVSAADLSKIGPAFFNSNAVVSAIYLGTVVLAVAFARF